MKCVSSFSVSKSSWHDISVGYGKIHGMWQVSGGAQTEHGEPGSSPEFSVATLLWEKEVTWEMPLEVCPPWPKVLLSPHVLKILLPGVLPWIPSLWHLSLLGNPNFEPWDQALTSPAPSCLFFCNFRPSFPSVFSHLGHMTSCYIIKRSQNIVAKQREGVLELILHISFSNL